MEKQKIDQRQNIFKYFFIVGPDIPKNKKITNSRDEISTAKIKIKSHYSIEGNTSEYETLYNDILTDKFVQYNIFPSLSNYIQNLDFSKEIDELNIKDIGIFEGYYFLEQNKPNFKFHSFQHKNWSNVYYEWFFNVLIFYEYYPSQVEDNYIKLYIANAMILISHEGYLSLSNYILTNIYNQFHLENTIPIEPYIINILNNITNKYDVIEWFNLKYEIINSFLPVYDLEILNLFHIFHVRDIFLFAEQFFKRETIIIASCDYDILFPIYYSLICLFHPLGNTDATYCYKLLNPITLSFIFGPLPSMIFIYCNHLDEKIIKQICEKKGERIIYSYIEKNKNYKANDESSEVYLVYKKIFELNEKNEIIIKNFPSPCDLLKSLLKIGINGIDSNFNLINYCIEERNQQITNEIPGFYENFEHYEILRNQFFTIILKLFLTIIQEIVFEINGEKIQMNSKVLEKENDDDDNENILQQNYLSDLKSSPSFEFIYKDDESNLRMDNPNLKIRNLLDLFITLSQLDKNIVYFDISLKKKENLKTINIEKLYNDILNSSFYYLNKYQRYFLRNKEEDILIEEKEDKILIKYNKIQLYFNAFTDSNLIQNNIHENINLIMMEFENFYNLYSRSIIPITSKKDIALGVIALTLIIILKYNINNQYLTDQEKLNEFEIVLNLFKETKGFYNKYNFLISILYEIIISNHEICNKYKNEFIQSLNEYKIIPTTTIFLEYNNKIDLTNNDLYEKEKLIFNISDLKQVNEENHNFEFFKEIYSDYLCSDKDCNFPLYFSYVDDIGEEKEEILKNPHIILLNICNKIRERGSFEIKNINYFYNKWFEDLIQISFLAHLYFNLELFPKL